MKEKIVVKNFSVIDDIEIDVKKINILIGPQAIGKSLLAKLVYFFKTINTEMQTGIIYREGKRQLDSRLKEKFNRIFPEYLINKKAFDIIYYYGNNYIKISNEKEKKYKSIKILYSDDIYRIFQNLKKDWERKKPSEENVKPEYLTKLIISIASELERLFYGLERYSSAFIPAGRSFFVVIEKSIFTLLAKSEPIDYMLIQFGSFLEKIRYRYKNINPQKDLNEELYRMCSKVLRGEYQVDDSFEWIESKDNPWIFLRNSSSGQQEVAPLLVSLMVLSNTSDSHYRVFIEEPETHLFPESQRNVVEIIATIYNLLNRKSGFFITTHSPYILTAFNNLIQAENTYFEVMERFEKGEIDEGAKNKRLKELDKVVKPNKRVSFDDVAVYWIDDGKCKNIKNNENKLIDDSAIDGVSDITAGVFGKLLDISFGDE
jgi:predicted ATPase